MNIFNFTYELSPAELTDCIESANDIASELLGPINQNSFKDTSEHMMRQGLYAHLSRLVIMDEGELETVVIEGAVFNPDGDYVLDEDEDSGPIKTYEGTIFDFDTDLADKTFNVTHSLGSLTVNAIGDIELERHTFIDPEDPDPASSGVAPTLADQMALSEIRTIFLT